MNKIKKNLFFIFAGYVGLQLLGFVLEMFKSSKSREEIILLEKDRYFNNKLYYNQIVHELLSFPLSIKRDSSLVRISSRGNLPSLKCFFNNSADMFANNMLVHCDETNELNKRQFYNHDISTIDILPDSHHVLFANYDSYNDTIISRIVFSSDTALFKRNMLLNYKISNGVLTSIEDYWYIYIWQ